MAGQRDIIRCPENQATSSPEQIQATERCIREAVTAGRPFVTRVGVNVVTRGTGPQHVVGRVLNGEIEIFVFLDVNAGQAGARVVGARCEGFTGLNCSQNPLGVDCSLGCRTALPEAPSPPYPAPPNAPLGVWCGPAF